MIADPGSLSRIPIPKSESLSLSRIALVLIGTQAAPPPSMARKLEELPVHSKALEFSVAVIALLDRPGFSKNCRLRDQIDDANESILSNMAEGFEQPTDKAVVKYLFDSKGSAAEVLTRLASAQRRGYITLDEYRKCRTLGEEVQRMLGGWIKYLARCDWKDRGRRSDP